MDKTEKDITLPLDSLIANLNKEGLNVSVDVQLRMQKALHSLGIELLNNPNDIKFILCPIVARNKAEQEKFNRIFDDYFSEIKFFVSELYTQNEVGNQNNKKQTKTNKWKTWIMLCSIFLLGIFIFVFHQFYFFKSNEEKPNKEKDAITSNKDSLSITLGKCDTLPNTHFIVNTDSFNTAEKTLIFYNKTIPKTRNVEFRWNFGEGTSYTSNDTLITHKFNYSGKYLVTLNARNTRYKGGCDSTYSKYIKITLPETEKRLDLKEFAPLYDKDLKQEKSFTNLAFLIIVSTFVFVLIIIELVFYWKRNTVFLTKNSRTQFKAGKKPPFYLPFPKQDNLIQSDTDIYEIANSLRQRNEGEHYKLDVKATLYETIRNAGLPKLFFKHISKPSEYLILIDQQSKHHQLSHLFLYFINNIEKEDVLIEQFLYDSDPRLCWNKEFPDGLSLGQLNAKYPKHRLILFGSGAGFIDDYFESKLYDWTMMFNSWKERAILTPNEVSKWNHREKLLNDMFVVLPATLEGQLAIVDNITQPEPPEFKETKRRFELLKNKDILLDTTHLAELNSYLGNDMYLWFISLAVYPTLSWEITLAIGSSIEQYLNNKNNTKKILLSYEKLLKLTNLKHLHTASLDPKFRETLLVELKKYPEIELAARKAVLTLLDKTEVPIDSFANREKQVETSVNKALTNLEDSKAWRILHYLWQKGIIDYVLRKLLKNELGYKFKHSIIRFSILIFLFAVLYLITNGFDYKNAYSQLIGINSIFEKINQIEISKIDSAVYYNNLGAGIFPKNLDSAEMYFNKSIEFSQKRNRIYKLPQVNKSLLYYKKGLDYYYNDSLLNAIKMFYLAETQDTLKLHSYNNLGISWFYIGRKDSAITYLNKIYAVDSSFFVINKPTIKDLFEPVIRHNLIQDSTASSKVDVEEIDFIISEAKKVGITLSKDKPIQAQLDEIKSFKTSDLEDLDKITDISFLSKLNNLEIVQLRGLSNLKDISPLKKLSKLNFLSLNGCSKITDFSPISHIISLEELYLQFTQISNLTALTGLANLKILHLSNCKNLTDINAIMGLNLNSLYIENTNLDNAQLQTLESKLKLINPNIDINIKK